MVWVFQAIVKRGNEALIHMETDTLLGSEREDIVAAAKQKPVEPYKLSTQVKTAAFPFRKPSARGKPLRMFFMTPTNYDREIVELAQRMDLDFRTIFCYSRDLKRPASVKMQRAIEEADPECLVISAMFWSSFTPELRKMVLTRVSQGMGLVHIDPTRLDEPLRAAMKLTPLTVDGVTRGLPLKEMRLIEAYGEPDRWIQAAQFAEGRIVLINHGGRDGHLLADCPSANLRLIHLPSASSCGRHAGVCLVLHHVSGRPTLRRRVHAPVLGWALLPREGLAAARAGAWIRRRAHTLLCRRVQRCAHGH